MMAAETIEIFLADADATRALGISIAPQLRAGMILSLVGGLGAGKTTLTQGIIAGLGGDENKVSSPTFSLVHEYKTAKFSVMHCDFYRLKPENELEDLGGTEFFFQNSLFIVEWMKHSGVEVFLDKNQILTVELQTERGGRKCLLPRRIKNS